MAYCYILCYLTPRTVKIIVSIRRAALIRAGGEHFSEWQCELKNFEGSVEEFSLIWLHILRNCRAFFFIKILVFWLCVVWILHAMCSAYRTTCIMRAVPYTIGSTEPINKFVYDSNGMLKERNSVAYLPLQNKFFILSKWFFSFWLRPYLGASIYFDFCGH